MDDETTVLGILYTFIPDLMTIAFIISAIVLSRCYLKQNPNRESTSSFIQAEAFASIDRGIDDNWQSLDWRFCGQNDIIIFYVVSSCCCSEEWKNLKLISSGNIYKNEEHSKMGIINKIHIFMRRSGHQSSVVAVGSAILSIEISPLLKLNLPETM